MFFTNYTKKFVNYILTLLLNIQNLVKGGLNLTLKIFLSIKNVIKKITMTIINIIKKITKIIFSLINTIIFFNCLILVLISFTILKIYFFIKNIISKKKIKNLYEKLEKSKNYKEWLKIAKIIDIYNGRISWKSQERSSYNYNYLKEIIKNLNNFLKNKKIEQCSNFLRSILHKDTCGINKTHLYNYCLSGTKDLITIQNKKILQCLEMIYNSKLVLVKKKQLFKEFKHIYGKSGIVFSGGGGLGNIHLGVLSVLLEEDLLPNVISGASVGSLIVGLIGTKTKEDLMKLNKSFFCDLNFDSFEKIPKRGNLVRKFIRFLKHGVLLDRYPLKQFFVINSDNLTFLEAYKKTGVKINITVTDSVYEKFKVLNYITAPNVYLWSACLASCSFPGLMTPTKIMRKTKEGKKEWIPNNKTFTDGTIGADIPKKIISSLFNVKNFIVSQVNPFVVPFLKKRRKKNSIFFLFWKIWDGLSQFVFSEFRHRIEQLDHLNLVPKKFILFYNLLLQKYTGNVNIVPKLGITDYFTVLDNPSKEGFYNGVVKGRGLGYAAVGQIRNFMEIEKKLKYYDTQLKKIVD